MVEKPKSLHVLGLEICGDEVRGAKLSQQKGKPALDSLFTIAVPTDSGETVKPLYIQSTGKSLQDVAKRYLIAATLPAGDVLVRSLDLSLKKAGDIDSVLAFQAEPLLPYPAEAAILDRIILSQSTEGTQLTVLATKKERAAALIDTWKSFHVEPEVVTAAPAALAAFSTLVAAVEGPLFVVHIARTQTICVLVRGGKLIASQQCSCHLDTLEKAFAADMPDLPAEEQRAAFNAIHWDDVGAATTPALRIALDTMHQELTRTLFGLGKQNKGGEVADILLTGDCGSNYDLMFHLGHTLDKNILTPDIPAAFNAPLPQMLKYAVPIGAALESLPQHADAVNFRQGELTYPDPWKRLKQPLAIYFGLCLALAAAFYIYGEAYLGVKEDAIREEYTALLTVVQKPHSEFEREIAGGGTEVPALKNISMDQLTERVATLQKELASSPDIFPLLPNILTVSDVLAWLNIQPTVVQKDPKTGKITPLIQIDSFSYAMVKRPEIAKKNERYQVKVEIEFTAPTPKEAREFHDALIAPNTLVDPKGEVKWSTNRGKYRASFYLKDRTIYPGNN